MKTFKQVYNILLNESTDLTADWNSKRLIGDPPRPLIAEYKADRYKNEWNSPYGVRITLDNNGGGKPLILLTAWMSGKNINKSKSGYNFVEDTPENRLKIEKRYTEVIYALMKVQGQLPKKVFPYVKAILEKSL